MKLSEREEKLLMRALDKASSPAEAEKAAQALINPFWERGINGHAVTELFGGSSPSAVRSPDPFSSPFPPSSPEHCWKYDSKTNIWTKKPKPPRFDEWLESDSDQGYEEWCQVKGPPNSSKFLRRPKTRLLKANVAVLPTEVAPDLSVSEN
jgi:hypothetical protein